MATLRDYILGPKVPKEIILRDPERFKRPRLFLSLAAILVLISIFLPYWRIKLYAPQYPQGLVAQVYINRVTGDVREIDELNHYIGMRPLEDAAQLERSLSIYLIIAMALLLWAANYIHSPFAAVLSLPIILFPLIFAADLYYWLWYFGTHLDPHAPLSSSVKPFVPPLIGWGKIGQFKVFAMFHIGFWLAVLASILTIVGLYYHRKAYKDCYEQYLRTGKACETTS